MQIIQNINSTSFNYNGLKYMKNFIVIKQGNSNVAIHNYFDTTFQLMPSTPFNQIQIDGFVYDSQAELMSVLAPLLFAKEGSLGGGGAVESVNDKTGVVILNKTDIGLGNTDNTSDANKPISTATQTALDTKANIVSPSFSGTVSLPASTSIGSISSTEISYLDGTTSNIQTQLDSKEGIISSGTTSQYFRGDKQWSVLNKAAVNLALVDNTADSTKNVLSASKLTTPRTINGVNFDGTSNIIINATDLIPRLSTSGGTVTGTLILPSATTIGSVSSTEISYLDSLTSNVQTQLNSKASLTGGGASGTWGISITGNSATSTLATDATTLATPRNINGVPFDGSANITIVDSTKQPTSEKNVANGYAGLDAGGKLLSNQLPAIAITDTFLVASQSAMLALSAETGDVAIRTDLSKSFILQTMPATTIANWQELRTPTDTVQSVFGRSGVVSAVNGDYTTALVTETTNKNYQTDNQKLYNDATSSIQTQLNAKASLASPNLIGTPTATTPNSGDNSTRIATTAFVQANSFGGSGTTNFIQKVIGAGTLGNSLLSDSGNDIVYQNVTYPFTSTTAGSAYLFNQSGSNGAGIGAFKQTFNTSDLVLFTQVGNNNSTEVARFKATGNVGIGTTTPSQKLDVNGNINSNSRYILNDGVKTNQLFGGGNYFTSSDSNNVGIRNDSGDILFAAGNATEDLVVKASGNIGIGTTLPIGKLNINTGLSGTTYDLINQQNGSISFCNSIPASSNPIMAGKSNTAMGLYLLAGTNDANSQPDMVLDVRENDNTDFSTLTSSAFKFTRFNNGLLDIRRDGNVMIGNGSQSSDSKLNVQVSKTGTYISSLTTPNVDGFRVSNFHNAGGTDNYSSLALHSTANNGGQNAYANLSVIQPLSTSNASEVSLTVRTSAGSMTEVLKANSTGKMWINSNESFGTGKLNLSATGAAILLDINREDATITSGVTGGAGLSLSTVPFANGVGGVFGNNLLGYSKNPLESIGIRSACVPLTDTGTQPLIKLEANGSGTNGFASITNVATRPILGVYNYSTQLMNVQANGKVGIGVAEPIGRLDINTGSSAPLGNPATQASGTISFGNGASGSAIPTIYGKSDTSVGLQLLGASNESNSSPDMSFNIRENDNTDFSGLTSVGFRFSRFGTTLIDVLRNGNTTVAGTVTAPTFIGVLNGNATTSTTLQTARTINGVAFNGSSNITVNATDSIARLALTGGTLTGGLNGTTANFTTFTGALVGNASTATLAADATTLATPRTINGVNFDGSANITINAVDATARLAIAGGTLTGALNGTTAAFTTVTAALVGNSTTSTTLQTARTINGVSFNGSSNITINAVDSTARLALTGGTLTGALNGTTAVFSGIVTAPTAADGTNTTQVATTAFVKSAIDNSGAPNKVYKAIINQSGTSAPTAVVLANTLGGTVVWTRIGTGQYYGTLSGAFPVGQTLTLIQTPTNGTPFSIGILNANNNQIFIDSFTNGTATDGLLNKVCISVEIF